MPIGDSKITFNVPIREHIFQNGKEFLIRGTAINETTTRNNVRYLGEELRKSAYTLRNKPILKDHKNEIDSIVGKTTHNVDYNEAMKRVDFEAVIVDEAMKKKIEQGLIQSVSIGANVDLRQSEKADDGSFIARGIDFLELSLVAVPADPNAGFTKALCEKFQLMEAEEEEIMENAKLTEMETAVKKLAEDSGKQRNETLDGMNKVVDSLKSIGEALLTINKKVDEQNAKIAEMQTKAVKESEPVKENKTQSIITTQSVPPTMTNEKYEYHYEMYEGVPCFWRVPRAN